MIRTKLTLAFMLISVAICVLPSLSIGQTMFNGHSYQLTAPMTIGDARQAASNMGGYLVAINDQAENDFVFQTFVQGATHAYIGLSDELVEGNFLWDSGEPLNFTNWNPGEPSGNSNFVRITVGGIWDDAGAVTTMTSAVIEIPITPAETDGPNAKLRLQGQTASVVDPVGHDIPLTVPGNLTLEIDSGANTEQPFILLAKVESPGDPSCFAPEAITTPFGAGGGSIDMTMAGIEVVLNGFAPGVLGLFSKTDSNGLFAISTVAPVGLVDLRVCFQAIVADPSAAGGMFMLDNTELGSVLFQGSITNLIPGLPDDGFVQHLLNVPISLYGQQHTQLFVGSNGYITFNAGADDFSESLADFFGGLGSNPGTNPPNPAVALYYSDLNNGGSGVTGSTYKIIENLVTNTVEVQFKNQQHWAANQPAGDFSVLFSNDDKRITFDYTNFIPATTAADDGIFGVSNGDPTVGTDTDLSDGFGTGTSAVQGSFVSGASPNSIGELIPTNTPFGSQIYNFTDVGIGDWVIN